MNIPFLTTQNPSPKGTWNVEDLKKTLKNALVFLAPTLLVFLMSVKDIVPPTWKYAAFAMWGLKVLTELLQRFMAEK